MEKEISNSCTASMKFSETPITVGVVSGAVCLTSGSPFGRVTRRFSLGEWDENTSRVKELRGNDADNVT